MIDTNSKILIFIVFDVVLIICTILFYHFIKQNSITDVQSVVNENIDGSIIIYTVQSFNLKIIIFYLLFTITSNLIIITILSIIECIKIMSISLKYKLITIISFNILSSILLFPSIIGVLIFNILRIFKK
jgi:hypothetical protein